MSSIVNNIPSILRSLLKFCLINLIVCISAERPSRAKNSDWRGISVVFDATNELIVSRPSAGGQSTKIKSKLSSKVNLVDEMTSYHLRTGGKRLRALLTLGSARICEYSKGSRDVNLAASV